MEKIELKEPFTKIIVEDSGDFHIYIRTSPMEELLLYKDCSLVKAKEYKIILFLITCLFENENLMLNFFNTETLAKRLR